MSFPLQATFSAISRITSFLLQILLLALLPKLLKEEALGLWFCFASFPFFVSFCDLGVGGLYLQHKLTTYITLQEFTKAKTLFFSTFYTIASFSSLLAVFIIILSPANWIFPSSSVEFPHLSDLFKITITLYLLKLPFSIASTAFLALNLQHFKSILEILEHLTTLTLCLCFFFLKGSLFKILTLTALSSLFLSIVFFFIFIMKTRWSFTPWQWVPISRFSMTCWLQNLFSVALFSPLPLLVANSISLKETAFFSYHLKALQCFLSVHIALLTPLLPLYTKHQALKNTESLFLIFYRSFYYSLLYFICCSCGIIFFYPHITFFLFGQQLRCPLIFLVWMTLYGTINILSIHLNGLAKIKKQTFFLFLGAVFLYATHQFFPPKSSETIILISIISQLPLLCSNIAEVHTFYAKKPSTKKHSYH